MTATKRKTITKKTRFEVFKRDGFKCVYCGACAPESVLVVDHIDPVAGGGVNEIVNYATACQPCNAGKSDRKLGDDSVLQKQRRQLEELGERREQLEMMLEWRNGLKDERDYEIAVLADAWYAACPGWRLSEKGRKEAKAYLKAHGLAAVLDAIETAADHYVKKDGAGKATVDSAGVAWRKVGGVLKLRSLSDDQRRLYYVQGILRNRLSHLPPDAIRYLQTGLVDGISVDEMTAEAKTARTWAAYRSWLQEQ